MKTERSAVAGLDVATSTNGRVSVVIPAYNASRFLAATLQSVRNQTQPPDEIIVVDDGSTDETAEIGRSVEGVTVISIRNGGPGAARNVGTQAASGEYIAFIDADDLWAPNKLSEQLAALRSFPRRAFSFTDSRVFDEHGFYRRQGELKHEWAFRKAAGMTKGREQIVLAEERNEPVMYDISYILPSSVLVRRADVLAVGGFDETLRYCEDYEFFLRLFAVMPAVVILKPLLFYRSHPCQGTKKAAVKMKAGHFDVARRTAVSPERYPAGDVQYIAHTDFLRHYRMAILHARLGQIDDSIRHLESSLAARWTLRASLLLVGSRICRSGPSASALRLVQALWRRRPGRR